MYSPQKQTAASADKSPGRREPIIVKRRNSLFASTSSPWFRRNLFLLSSMIESEDFSVYEGLSYNSEVGHFNIISLKECQGFMFNQDLFALPYQQLKSLENERRYRAMSFLKSRTASVSKQSCFNKRRHTLYHPRPVFSDGEDEDTDMTIDEKDDAVDDAGDDDVDNDVSAGGYRVHVTDIVVSEDDDSLFPTEL